MFLTSSLSSWALGGLGGLVPWGRRLVFCTFCKRQPGQGALCTCQHQTLVPRKGSWARLEHQQGATQEVWPQSLQCHGLCCSKPVSQLVPATGHCSTYSSVSHEYIIQAWSRRTLLKRFWKEWALPEPPWYLQASHSTLQMEKLSWRGSSRHLWAFQILHMSLLSVPMRKQSQASQNSEEIKEKINLVSI